MFKKFFDKILKNDEEDKKDEIKEVEVELETDDIDELVTEEEILAELQLGEVKENIQEQDEQELQYVEDLEVIEVDDKNKLEDEKVGETKEHEEIKKEEIVEETVPVEEKPEKINLFKRLKEGLSKTKQGITDKVDNLIKSYQKIDEEFFEELEEILITADIGVQTTMEIIDELKDKVKSRKLTDPESIKGLLKEELVAILNNLSDRTLNVDPSPAIILVVGVNGVGKTTSIGKIANKLRNEGKSVLLAAGDTFRAAAIDQLKIWGDRAGVDVIKHQEGSDPAAVIFDAIQAAKARKADVLICDTAGRLHNKVNLMNELGKVFRVVDREYGNATREVLLVLDATTGQNAIQQAKVFKEVVDISGLVLTKLDGTAKGGIVIAISKELNIPVKLIGVGEKVEDLQQFNEDTFVKALFGEE
ncbi:signal recognition particle-docking protein FtsY [Serpentinicella alkaliphila]|uniref:Signal recognition particle receptor FtsY n=1 Tax=Serpentinicella alkaliphila TaxID=1734049 RepID=A0A4R2UDL7_9FIRM|nr:signal recognition particle-docking protein FtsY [Serpentinicella alkaliphila]QUH26256.1 signal recognition particle-docking protein FtsY [Serpentinicella alkaliphila]TCQ05833.1 signal recognition particle-docking protein FtsY [Serpentinicella alkaliphila]